MKRILSIVLAALCIASCGSRSGKDGTGTVKHLKPVSVPSVYTGMEERTGYVLMHFWDEISGVPMDEVEQGLSNFIALLDVVPAEVSEKAVLKLFERISEEEKADTAAHIYVQMTQLVSKYLYDPNSPLRNEDYYLPFVKAMASSPLTSEDMRPAYRYEAESCAICRRGSVAPDFRFRTISGKTYSLHSLKAGFTMLFFSNPGCNACKEIIDQVMSNPVAVRMIEEKTLLVVNVYIDEDLKAWREYESNYPSSWYSGYDYEYLIRGSRIYDVRAIPSLYLLDSGKKIIFKDAPTEKVLAYLQDNQ